MGINPKCKYCGSDMNVFTEAVMNANGAYSLSQICINCKNKEINDHKIFEDINNIRKWETDLKKIESQISKQIVYMTFPLIKFKKAAVKKLTKLMRKYPIRKIFEVCALLPNNRFSISEIEKNCKKEEQ